MINSDAMRHLAESMTDDSSLMSDFEGLLAGDVSWDEIDDTPGEDPAIVYAETFGGTVESWRETFAD